jgi:hypothetical protein
MAYRARYDGECILCGRPIVKGEPVFPTRGTWAHAACGSGGDE